MPRLALVTGGTRGIGAAISATLKESGYLVAANYVGNDQTAQEFYQVHDIPIYKYDVSDFESSKKMIQLIEQDFQMSIEILINNAGISRDSMCHKMTLEDWNKVININLNSIYNVTRNVIEKMRHNNFGRIVNISSVNGLTGQLGLTNYCAAKAGVIGFTRALAKENAKKNITVNAVAPGYIETDLIANIAENVLNTLKDLIPIGKFGKPEDVAKLVRFLVDEDSWYITGETISINGGQHMT